MLNYGLIHPELIAALAASGHGTQILIADGYYPHNTGAPASARRVYLNLTPGVLDIDTILQVLLDAVPIEAAGIMLTADGEDSDAVKGYLKTLTEVSEKIVPITKLAVNRYERFDFYDAARHDDVALVICSADTRQYANLLVTVGVAVRERMAGL